MQQLAPSNAADAAVFFAGIAREYDARDAWLGLAFARHVQAEPGPAAEALGEVFGRHAFAIKRVRTVDAIVQAIDAPGWCALDGQGGVTVQLTRRPPRGVLPIAAIDQQPLRLRAEPDGRAFGARLPNGWERAKNVVVHLHGAQLVGSPCDIETIMRVEGFVDTTSGDLNGWAWYPNNPDINPVLSIVPVRGGRGIKVVADQDNLHIHHNNPLARPRGFRVPAERLERLAGLLHMCGQDGRPLMGSPVDPSAERLGAHAVSALMGRMFQRPRRALLLEPAAVSQLPMPAHVLGSRTNGGLKKRPVDVVVPVNDERDSNLACLDSILRHLPAWARLVVVQAPSPGSRVAQGLRKLAARNHLTLLTQTLNCGFPSLANVGMRHDPSRDVALLYPDILVPPAWLKRLREAAYETPTTGTATPLSNDATFLGYPSTEHANAIVQPEEAIRLDLLAQKANADQVVDIPAAIGSCWYIKRDCLDATGLFRDDLFAQGHGEENDFCIRARHLGWRHVAAPGIFVAHIDGRPASSAEHYLIERNTRLLNRLHPGYDKLISESRTVDPIGESRRRIDTELWRTLRSGNESVLLITHDRRGGVQRRVAERAASLRADGLRPIVLSPIACSTGRGCVLSDGLEGGTPNLRFAIPAELDLLAELLKADRPQRGEVHHLIGHDHALLDLFRRLGIPYEVVIHDYNWICPRINLIGSAKRYCAEPDLVACEACVADAGTANDEDTAPRALRERSLAELAGASRVVVPSQDTATRLQRYFPHVPTDVVPWEDDSGSSSPKSAHIASDDVRRICVVGAISIEKGYEVLLACARDASRRDLKLEFHLVGESCDDARLLATERVHITGRFDEHEALQLIHAQRAQLGWLPSLWPETWCYALTRMWQAGLKTVAFDIGAQAERIRRTGRGWLYPLGLEPATLNARLLQHADASNPSMPKDAR